MLEGFPVTAAVEVRWRDLDPMGHVNNAVYLTYFEMARTRYFADVLGARGVEDINFILASVRCDFLSPALFGETLEVGIRVPGVGRTSFEFEYEVRSAKDGRTVARGRSTQVLFDYAKGEKISIEDEWLDKVAAAQGQRPERRG
jgi:acyl-CoA thioester hydrolase